MTEMNRSNALDGVAVIGMAGRFPGARTVAEFWENLCKGVESLTCFSDEELLASGVSESLLKSPAYVKNGFVVADSDQFDAQFFGVTPREAEFMDPQHRIFLECAWEALEDAGCDPTRYPGAIGVFAGCGMNNYVLNNLVFNRRLMETVGEFQTMVGNDKDFLTTRISYKLDLRGPSLDIQTACSTSLVAVQVAFQSLLSYQCDAALAGGISLAAARPKGYLYTEGQIPSPDGHCRAFDRNASGTALGEGVGIVVLKRLEDAVADGDNIYAVIRGAAINNDGASKVGYTAPSVDGQAAVVAMAQALAGFDPRTISYVEAHGTGTPLGDPIEIAALSQAFGSLPPRSCALGSVKTNIGHLDAAAGVAGLIKAILALRHRRIPPSINCESPSPRLNLDSTPFFVNTTLKEWKPGDTPLRAGVSSFGIGGTNSHVVLEESPPLAASSPPRPWELVVLSARTPTALDRATQNLAEHLRANPDLNLGDVAFTLQTGRRAFFYRRAFACRDAAHAAQALAEAGAPLASTAKTNGAVRSVAFMFAGQGAQYVNMGKGLYETEPAFREAVDACARVLEPHLGFDLRKAIYPSDGPTPENSKRLEQTALAQPAVFTVEYALAQLCAAWGFVPGEMIGHSLGEYVAATLAGVFTLEEALELVAARGRLIQELPPGAMLAVPLSEQEVRARLNGSVSLAAVNGPSLCSVSGPPEAVEAFQKRLLERGVECRRLHTSHAFHSDMMRPILDPFRRAVEKARPKPPKTRFVSNLTGRWISDAEACDPAYWVDHMRRTVRFSEGVGALLGESPAWVLVEAGPGNTLCALARQQPGFAASHAAIPLVRHPNESQCDAAFLMNALGKMWLAGVQIDWGKHHAGRTRRRVPLPTYPFERRRYWIEPEDKVLSASDGSARSSVSPAEGADAERDAPEGELDAQTAALHGRSDLSSAYAAPTNEIEKTIVEIWETLLGIQHIGIHDNFFELGGHSLLASQAIARIRDAFQFDVPIRQAFDTPTVAGLADYIARSMIEQEDDQEIQHMLEEIEKA